jgi:hypothetical protein
VSGNELLSIARIGSAVKENLREGDFPVLIGLLGINEQATAFYGATTSVDGGKTAVS